MRRQPSYIFSIEVSLAVDIFHIFTMACAVTAYLCVFRTANLYSNPR